MTLVMTLLVRDEEDIVDATVGFHLERGVDLVLVTDNLSVDRTRDLLADFERQGVVQVWSEPNDEYRQWEWVSRMAQTAATRYGADWVLNADADEFWWTDRPLPELLAEVPTGYDVVQVPRHDFLPLDADSGLPFHERMVIRDTAPRTILRRPLMAKCAHRARDDVILAQGNHFVVNQGMVEMPEPMDALIQHFPVRTYAQLERKIVLGGRAYARNRDMPATVGNTWRTLYRAYLDGRLREWFDGLVPDEATMVERLESGRYAVDTRLRDALGGRASLPPLVPEPAGHAVPGNDAEEGLLAFVDDARHSLTVQAAELSACGVLAALAGARQHGIDVRVLCANGAATAGWRLDEVTRVVAGPLPEAVVVRDGTSAWCGPAHLTPGGLHGPVRVEEGEPLVASFEQAWSSAAALEPVSRSAHREAMA